jgi:prolipoprotein diacylglyceryltransferase
MFLYWKTNARKYEGFIFGVFLIGVFLTRFLLEFIKNNQESFEDSMVLNMGQLLSVPLIVWGVYLLIKSFIEISRTEGGLRIMKD